MLFVMIVGFLLSAWLNAQHKIIQLAYRMHDPQQVKNGQTLKTKYNSVYGIQRKENLGIRVLIRSIKFTEKVKLLSCSRFPTNSRQWP